MSSIRDRIGMRSALAGVGWALYQTSAIPAGEPKDYSADVLRDIIMEGPATGLSEGCLYIPLPELKPIAQEKIGGRGFATYATTTIPESTDPRRSPERVIEALRFALPRIGGALQIELPRLLLGTKKMPIRGLLPKDDHVVVYRDVTATTNLPYATLQTAISALTHWNRN